MFLRIVRRHIISFMLTITIFLAGCEPDEEVVVEDNEGGDTVGRGSASRLTPNQDEEAVEEPGPQEAASTKKDNLPEQADRVIVAPPDPIAIVTPPVEAPPAKEDLGDRGREPVGPRSPAPGVLPEARCTNDCELVIIRRPDPGLPPIAVPMYGIFPEPLWEFIERPGDPFKPPEMHVLYGVVMPPEQLQPIAMPDYGVVLPTEWPLYPPDDE